MSLNACLLSSSSILIHAHAQRKQYICGLASFKSECGAIACFSTENSRGGALHNRLYFHLQLGSRYRAIKFLCLTPWLHKKFTLDSRLFSIHHIHRAPGEALTVSKLALTVCLTSFKFWLLDLTLTLVVGGSIVTYAVCVTPLKLGGSTTETASGGFWDQF